MKYTVSKNNIHIVDSYLISKNEFDNELKFICWENRCIQIQDI